MPEMERYIKGVCRHPECGATVKLLVGDMDAGQIRETLRQRQGYECPGGGLPHMELGNMLAGYDWDFAVFEDAAPMTDVDYLKTLKDEGHEVLSGVSGKFPELPCLHDVPGLRHVGFGDFEDDDFYYRRMDSPKGMRFYVREKRSR